MRLPAVPRRAVVGGAVAVAVVASGALSLSYAADPSTGCVITDPAGDAQVPGLNGADDGNLDLLSAAVAGDGAGLAIALKVVALTETGPDLGLGDAHELQFTLNAKTLILGSYRYIDSGFEPVTYASVAGTSASPASLKVVYDIPKSTMTFTLSAADLATMAGAPAAGKPLAGLTARAFFSTAPFSDTDVASDTATSTAVYTYGGACAAPAPTTTAMPSSSGTPSASSTPSATASASTSSTPTATTSASTTPTATPSATATPAASPAGGTTIALSGPTRVQFSDPFTTLVTLKDSAGNPLSGKRVTAKHGGAAAVAGTTNSSGQVRLTTPVKERSATRNLVVSFAGDASSPAKSVTRAITTVNEVTRLRKTVSGSGSTRTVTVQLVEDDATTKVLAGRRILVQYSGTSVTLTTDSSGRAQVTAKAGAAMDITFTGETGTYAQAKIRTYAT